MIRKILKSLFKSGSSAGQFKNLYLTSEDGLNTGKARDSMATLADKSVKDILDITLAQSWVREHYHQVPPSDSAIRLNRAEAERPVDHVSNPYSEKVGGSGSSGGKLTKNLKRKLRGK